MFAHGIAVLRHRVGNGLMYLDVMDNVARKFENEVEHRGLDGNKQGLTRCSIRYWIVWRNLGTIHVLNMRLSYRMRITSRFKQRFPRMNIQIYVDISRIKKGS